MPNEPHEFTEGDVVKVVGGPFTDFKGIVTEPSPSPARVGVKLAFFGRKAAVTLDARFVLPLRENPPKDVVDDVQQQRRTCSWRARRESAGTVTR